MVLCENRRERKSSSITKWQESMWHIWQSIGVQRWEECKIFVWAMFAVWTYLNFVTFKIMIFNLTSFVKLYLSRILKILQRWDVLLVVLSCSGVLLGQNAYLNCLSYWSDKPTWEYRDTLNTLCRQRNRRLNGEFRVRKKTAISYVGILTGLIVLLLYGTLAHIHIYHMYLYIH